MGAVKEWIYKTLHCVGAQGVKRSAALEWEATNKLLYSTNLPRPESLVQATFAIGRHHFCSSTRYLGSIRVMLCQFLSLALVSYGVRLYIWSLQCSGGMIDGQEHPLASLTRAPHRDNYLEPTWLRLTMHENPTVVPVRYRRSRYAVIDWLTVVEFKFFTARCLLA